MTVNELTRDQLVELKGNYFTELHNGNVSYGELAIIDDLVSDETIFEEYGGYVFSNDDFFCTAGQEEKDE